MQNPSGKVRASPAKHAKGRKGPATQARINYLLTSRSLRALREISHFIFVAA